MDEFEEIRAARRRDFGPKFSDQQVLVNAAKELGTTPQELATVISYESGFNPGKWGGAEHSQGSYRKGGNHLGLIQFGPRERELYKVHAGQSFAEQMPAVVQFLKDRGFRPGMGILDLYSTINSGSPGNYDASDGRGTVRSHVASMLGEHQGNVNSFFKGTLPPVAPSEASPAVSPEGEPADDTDAVIAAMRALRMGQGEEVAAPPPAPAPAVKIGSDEVVVSAPPPQRASWGGVEKFIDAALPGSLGLKAMAGVDTLAQKVGVPNWLMGRDSEAPKLDYAGNLQALEAAKKSAEIQGNGGGVAKTLGTVAGLYGANRLAGAALSPISNAIASKLPYFAKLDSFLSGTAGLEKAAIGPQANALSQGAVRGGSLLANGVLQGELADAYESGGLPHDPARSAIVGGLLNVPFGYLGDKLNAASRTNPLNPNIADDARVLQKLGVTPTPWQLSADQSLVNSGSGKSLLPGVGWNASQAATQLQDYTNAFLKRTGAEALPAQLGEHGYTPAVAKANLRRIGDEMDMIAGLTPQIHLDPQQLQGILAHAQANATTTDAKKAVKSAVDAVTHAAMARSGGQGFFISGEDYQRLTKLGEILSNLKKDGNTYQYGEQIRNFLDDALENAAPYEQKAALANLRTQYRETKLVEKAVGGTDSGLIDPKAILRQVASGEKKSWTYSPEVQALAAYGNMHPPKPMESGGVKSPGWHVSKPEAAAGIGAVAFGPKLMDNVAPHLGTISDAVTGNPFMSIPAIGGAIGALGLLGAQAYKKNKLNSPAVTNYLLSSRRPTQTFNPFILPTENAYENR